MLFSIFTFFKTIKYLKYPRKQIVFTRIKKLTRLMANCAGTDLVFLSKSRITYLSLSVYLVFILHVSLIYRSKLKMWAPNQIFSRFFLIIIYIYPKSRHERTLDGLGTSFTTARSFQKPSDFSKILPRVS